MPTVFIAGATGYLGRHLCTAYRSRGWRVRALVRNVNTVQSLDADALVEAEATRRHTLEGIMDGCDLVVSALGITRQADGLGYWDVDYDANMNLLDEAKRAAVQRFAYIHVLNAAQMPDVPLVAAKAAFVRVLQKTDIASTVIAPSGYFSDMADFVTMARSGRVWLFGSGCHLINPVHGADLALAAADAIERGEAWLDVGGPDIFSQTELARMAFAASGRPARITCLPDWIRRVALVALPFVTPRRIHGPATFFLSALGMDMVGKPHGTRHLDTHFAALVAQRFR